MRGGIVALAFVVLFGPTWIRSASASDATPSSTLFDQSCNRPVGRLDQAQSHYEIPNFQGFGTFILTFTADEYDTPEQAHAFLFCSKAVGWEGIEFAPTSPPHLGDEAAAWTGKVNFCGTQEDLAILSIRVGRVLYEYDGNGINADPLPDLAAVAQRRFGPTAARATPNATPSTGDLASLLPTLADLPPGFVVRPPADGSIGSIRLC